MAFSELSEGDGPEKMREFFGPTQIEQGLRQSIQFCWMALPPEKRNIDELERQVMRVIDRIFKNMREDENAFSG